LIQVLGSIQSWLRDIFIKYMRILHSFHIIIVKTPLNHLEEKSR